MIEHRNVKKLSSLLLSSILCLLFSGIANAWWSTPHMLVAEIAYQQLEPDVRKRANALIAIEQDGYDFITAANWSDNVEDPEDPYKTRHAVKLSFKQINDPLPKPKDFPTEDIFANHVVVAIEAQKAVLTDPTRTDREKGLALRRLIHYVGDIHQPLHTAEHISPYYPNGDSGGTLFLLASEPPLTNLHKLWDSGLGQWVENFPLPLSHENRTYITLEAATLMQQAPTDLGSDDPYIWAIESHMLGRTYAFWGITYQGVPSDDYIARGAALCRSQMTLAGLRLAAILNASL